MAISVLTNVASLNAQRNLAATQMSLAASVGRLSSGQRINTASDDAAGLGISENLKANIRSLAQAQRNANDGISMSQVAEGSMNDIQGIVSRMRELSVQSSNSTLGDNERGYIQTEYTQLSSEINRISAVTDFNGQKLLDGSASAGLTFQIGIQNTANDQLAMSITKLTTSTLGSSSLHIASASLSTAAKAQAAIGTFDKAIQQLSQARAPEPDAGHGVQPVRHAGEPDRRQLADPRRRRRRGELEPDQVADPQPGRPRGALAGQPDPAVGAVAASLVPWPEHSAPARHVASIHRGLSRPLSRGGAAEFTPPCVASRGIPTEIAMGWSQD
jgi:flagellin